MVPVIHGLCSIFPWFFNISFYVLFLDAIVLGTWLLIGRQSIAKKKDVITKVVTCSIARHRLHRFSALVVVCASARGDSATVRCPPVSSSRRLSPPVACPLAGSPSVGLRAACRRRLCSARCNCRKGESLCTKWTPASYV